MDKRTSIGPIIMGVFSIVAILFVCSLVVTLLLQFTNIREASMNWFILPITLLTLLMGGLIAGYKSGSKGWVVGGLTGLCFLVITWMVSFLGFDHSATIKTFIMYASYLFLAMLGGMIGVNMSPRREA